MRDATGPGGDGTVQFEEAPAPALTVAFAPTKGERPEWVVQKLTELGHRPHRAAGERAQRRALEPDAGATAVERLRRVAREAAGQCRRVWLPEVSDVIAFGDLAGLGGTGAGRAGPAQR